jgi:hypothetical protein
MCAKQLKLKFAHMSKSDCPQPSIEGASPSMFAKPSGFPESCQSHIRKKGRRRTSSSKNFFIMNFFIKSIYASGICTRKKDLEIQSLPKAHGMYGITHFHIVLERKFT